MKRVEGIAVVDDDVGRAVRLIESDHRKNFIGFLWM
jgi:hypothetical protein